MMGVFRSSVLRATSTLSPLKLSVFTQTVSTSVPVNLLSAGKNTMSELSILFNPQFRILLPSILAVSILLAIIIRRRDLRRKRTLYEDLDSSKDRGATCPFSASPSSLHDQKPYEFPAIKVPSSSQMTMGLRRLDATNWLTITPSYIQEHALRTRLLTTQKSSVLQCLPGSEAACHEVLSLVSTFLLARYPHIFTLSTPSNASSPPTIHNALSGSTHLLGASNPSPLETAALLGMEDLNILYKSPSTDSYTLLASATLFPAGWKLQERIGHTISALHAPVQDWEKKLRCPVTRYFDHLGERTLMERHPLFVQCDDKLFCPDPLADGDTDHVPRCALQPEDVRLRRERQTFVPLKSRFTCSTGTKHSADPAEGKMILFAVHTYLTNLTDLGDEDLDAFVETVKNWPDEVAAYRGKDVWWDVVLRYWEERRRN